jgi:hypothetical protein
MAQFPLPPSPGGTPSASPLAETPKPQGLSSWNQSPRTTSRVWVLVICLAAALIFLGAACVAGTWDPPEEGTIGFELRKYLIQFLLLVALGAVVAFIVDDTNRRINNAEEVRRDARDRADRERQSAIDVVTLFLDRLGAIYREVKRKRHVLRLIPEEKLTKARYVERASELHTDKQALEVLWQDIETSARWLPELAPIWPHVKKMEDYLRPSRTSLRMPAGSQTPNS